MAPLLYTKNLSLCRVGSHSAHAFVQNTSHFAQLQEGNLTGNEYKNSSGCNSSLRFV